MSFIKEHFQLIPARENSGKRHAYGMLISKITVSYLIDSIGS